MIVSFYLCCCLLSLTFRFLNVVFTICRIFFVIYWQFSLGSKCPTVWYFWFWFRCYWNFDYFFNNSLWSGDFDFHDSFHDSLWSGDFNNSLWSGNFDFASDHDLLCDRDLLLNCDNLLDLNRNLLNNFLNDFFFYYNFFRFYVKRILNIFEIF